MSNDHREYRDELAAYALGALELPEKLEVERHVAGCDECREYLSWLDPAMDLLPMAAEQIEPPAHVKRAIMDTVREDVRSEQRAERERKRTERGFWGTFWRPVTMGALTFVLVAGAITGYELRGGSDDPVQTAFIKAESTDPGVGAAMEATLEREGDKGTLHVVKLPGLPSNMEYQAWINRDGELDPSTTFVVRKDGSNEVAIDGSLDGAEGVYITREPEGGSDRPTTPIIMRAPLS